MTQDPKTFDAALAALKVKLEGPDAPKNLADLGTLLQEHGAKAHAVAFTPPVPLTTEYIVGVYEQELARIRAEAAQHEAMVAEPTTRELGLRYQVEAGTTTEAGILKWACKATRSQVSGFLQVETPHPTEMPVIAPELLKQLPAAAQALLTDSGPDGLHNLQKSHFTTVWQRGDALVAAAGITENGRV